MRNISFALLATIALALIIRAFFYVTMPDVPLTPSETSVIVLIALGIVLGWKRLRTQSRKLLNVGGAAIKASGRAAGRLWNHLPRWRPK